MAKNFETMEDSNRSANPSIHEVSDPARRLWVHGGLAALAGGVLSPWIAGCASAAAGGPLLGFKAIPASTADTIVVPEGVSARVVVTGGLNNVDFSGGWDQSGSAYVLGSGGGPILTFNVQMGAGNLQLRSD